MYVTRPLSLYRTNPDALSLPPSSEGPNGGYLVLQDDERYIFGLLKDSGIRDLPFPQNKLHVVTHGSEDDNNTHHPVYFIPAINWPLSANIYYAIEPEGRHQGKAYASSTDEEMSTCCFSNCVNDVEPRLLDPADIYQRFKVSKNQRWGESGFSAISAARDGHPPSFLRWKGWSLESKTLQNFSLAEAAGMDPGLRARLPDFDFPLSNKASKPVVVGKWYCPFMFIKEYLTPKDQMQTSMFYEMTLEQQWERIFLCGNEYAGSSDQGNNTVLVDISVPTKSVKVQDTDTIEDDQENTTVWFDCVNGRTRVGLSSLVVRRMMWEEERGGWVLKEEKQEQVLKSEEFGGIGKWTSYGCYMLVERFILRRMDRKVVLSYSFNHTHQIRSKWE